MMNVFAVLLALLQLSLFGSSELRVLGGSLQRPLGPHIEDPGTAMSRSGAATPSVFKETNPMSSTRRTSPLKDVLIRYMTVKSDAARAYVLAVHTEALEAAHPAFAAAGSYGNGPAWTALAEYLLGAKPSLTGIDLDDEGDAFFAYSTNDAALHELRSRLIDTVSDDSKLREAVAAARARGFRHGDL